MKTTMILRTLSTFASQCLVFDQKNELFPLENASNLTPGFLYDNFNQKILVNFLVKIVIKNSFVKIDAFSEENGSFFSSKTQD